MCTYIYLESSRVICFSWVTFCSGWMITPWTFKDLPGRGWPSIEINGNVLIGWLMMNQISTMEKLLFHHKRHGCFNWMMVRKWVPWKNGVKITISIHPFKNWLAFGLYLEDLLTNFPSSFKGRMSPTNVNHAFFANGSCFLFTKSHTPKRRSLKGKIDFLWFL